MRLASMNRKGQPHRDGDSRNLTQAVCGFEVNNISFPFALLVVWKYTYP